MINDETSKSYNYKMQAIMMNFGGPRDKCADTSIPGHFQAAINRSYYAPLKWIIRLLIFTQYGWTKVTDLIDEILATKGPATYTDGLTEDNWEQVITDCMY